MSKLMTQSTCGMSKPREATSVASSTERDFDLNLFRAPRRLFYTQHKAVSPNSTSPSGLPHSVHLRSMLQSPPHKEAQIRNQCVCVPDSFVHEVG